MKPVRVLFCLLAALLLAGTPRASGNNAGAVVLVNSSSARYPDFQHFILPYLNNFGVPCTVLDIASNTVGSDLTNYALIIVGHPQLDTNLVFLNSAAQSNITAAVSNGTGLVSFDPVLSVSNTPLYQFEQNIFGFTYQTNPAVTNVVFSATEPGSQMHYITSLHTNNETLILSNKMNLTRLVFPTNVTAIVTSGGKPFVVIKKFGQGRAVQWAAFDWTSVSYLGPINGLDDVVWRGMVWAARKPFVMRGMQNFATMRIDDVSGPFIYVHTAVSTGFKPYLALFYTTIGDSDIVDLRGLITNGNVTASIHSFTDTNYFYFDHANGTNWSDAVMSNNYALGTKWYATNGIPISKMMIAHWSEMGLNCFAGLKAWGIEYVLIEIPPGNQEYVGAGSPWLMAGPYRLYETPQGGDSLLPMAYADFLTVPGHPEFNGQFFDPYTEIRNVYPSTEWVGGDWAPAQNDVAGSIDRGYKQIKRGLDSMTLGNVFTHETYVLWNIQDATWLTILQGITNKLAPYKPAYVTMDYANQYLRATRTSHIMSADSDPVTGKVSASFSGKTDMPISAFVYTGADSSITNFPGTVPVFNGSTNVAIGWLSVAAQFMTPTVQSGNLVSTLVGQYGHSYSIETSTDLKNWSPVQTVSLSNAPAVVSQPVSATGQFYRAKQLP
jgi:hypothetical protein